MDKCTISSMATSVFSFQEPASSVQALSRQIAICLVLRTELDSSHCSGDASGCLILRTIFR